MRTTFPLYAVVVAITLCVGFSSSHANVTINFTAGDLYKTGGSTTSNYMPTGGLLELIADTSSNGFSAPTATAFEPTGTDDVILATFSLNNIPDGDPGTTQQPLTYDPTKFPTLAAGDPIEIRWFPTLTSASTQPGAGTAYGQFRTNINQDGSNLTVPWASPASGTRTLNFLTTSDGGSNADILGEADLFVAGGTPLPEPSTYSMALGMAALGGLVYLRRRRRRN